MADIELSPERIAQILEAAIADYDNGTSRTPKESQNIVKAMRAAIPLVLAPRLIPWVENLGLWMCIRGHRFATKNGEPVVCRACETETALVSALKAVENAEANSAMLAQTNRDWLAANAPGGWIDELRSRSQQ